MINRLTNNNMIGIKKIFLSLLCVLISIKISSSNYYISTSSGNDANTSIQAQNPLTPWQTITKLNSIMSLLLPGDSILFKCGDTFYGSFTVTVSGNSNASIIFSSYGIGNKPIITGLTNLSTWTAVGNNLWEANCGSCGSDVNILVMNDSIKAIGRYPNYNSANKGYLNFESHIGNTQITDNQLTNTPNWTGAELVIRKNHWIIDRALITQHLNSTLSYTSSSSYTPIDNWGYFIQNHPSTLDQYSEWCYNPSLKKILVYSTVSPSIADVKVSVIDTLAFLENIDYVSFNNLNFKGSNKCGVFADKCSNLKITDCNILFSGIDGFVGYEIYNGNFENNTINFTNNNGFISRSGQFNTIKNNIVKNTATFPGIGQGGDINYIGMYCDGNNNSILFNTIDSTGYVALSVGSSNLLVKNNFINNYDLVKADGGGIYTYKGCSNQVYTNRKIIDNIVLNGINYSEGTDTPNILSGEGIYLDDNSDGVEISGNTVANCGKSGIFLHNAHEIDVVKNTVFNCGSNQLFLSEQHLTCTPYLLIRNVSIKNNIFFSKTESQTVANLITTNNDIDLFGVVDSNYYCRPVNQETIIYADFVPQNIQQWQSQYSKDSSSHLIPIQYPAYTLNSLTGTNKFGNQSFNTTVTGATCWASTPNNCVLSIDNSGMLDSGSLKLSFASVTTATHVSINYFNVGQVNFGKDYILKFSLIGSKPNHNIVLGIWNPAYTGLSPTQYCKIDTSRTENEILFHINANESNAKIVFILEEQDSTVWIDNFEFYEANVTLFNPDDNIRFEYNASQSIKVIPITDQYIDVKNNYYIDNLVLQPFTSLILMKLPYSLPNGLTNYKLLNEGGIKIYPNPTSGIINVQSTFNTIDKIGIYDIMGRKIIEDDYKKQVDLSSLNNGIYFLRFVNHLENLIITQKIIIQK